MLQLHFVLAEIVAEACMKDVAPGDIREVMTSLRVENNWPPVSVTVCSMNAPVYASLSARQSSTNWQRLLLKRTMMLRTVMAPLAPDDRNVTLKGPGNHNHTALSGALLASATGLRRRGAMGGC